MNILHLRDLRVTYRRTPADPPVAALRGVNLTVEHGELVGVAGESGSGKSTLAAAILRLLPATAAISGAITLDGVDVRAATWGQLRALRWAKAAIVFQGATHALNPVRRIGHQIAEPILTHTHTTRRAAHTQAGDLLRQVGLPNRAAAYPHQLSGGQRQRAMIAMALACQPRLIIADEPTTALDVIVQTHILRLLRDLTTHAGLTLLLISHDLPLLAATCDRLAVMYAGRVVETGPAAALTTTPRHPYTAALAAAHTRVADPAARRHPHTLPGEPPDPAQPPPGCAFHPRCPHAHPRCTRQPVTLTPPGAAHQAACLLPHPGGASHG